MTPPGVARFIASLFPKADKSTCRLLDAGAGMGALSAVIHDSKRDWLILVEAVTSHGPADGKRHDELARLFAASSAGLVFVTAFPTRALMARYVSEIAWETEVWVADAPTHLIHFNGSRFLGPYQ